jgi:hypothetical protein
VIGLISVKEAQENIVNIRQVWLKAINRCAEAIAYRYRFDVQDKYTEKMGVQMVIESVVALYTLLVDYGEAMVFSEVTAWRDTHHDEIENMRDQYKRMSWYRDWFEFMVKTLNKYGMLFESQPKGFSNVEMKSV